MPLSKVTGERVQGTRSHQEDRYFYTRLPSGWILAIMDGHGGSQTADQAVELIEKLVKETTDDLTDPKVVLSNLVSELVKATNKNYYSGATLSVALILEDRDEAFVAILGDSPVVVLQEEGETTLSTEHNVRSNEAERAAAIARGGVYLGDYIRNDSGDGILVSRSLGDMEFSPILSREPEIYSVERPRKVLVASDGVVSTGYRAVPEVLNELNELMTSAKSAQDVMEWKRQKGFSDNATALFYVRE